jgi:tetratricopeptide (TPR) repeat protein
VKTCYVSIPFGVKDGLDFEWTYRELILPAVLDAGLACQRGDEFGGLALIHKAILQAVIASDVVIADVSNNNPNVIYELGVRHALRRGITIILSLGHRSLPFHLQGSPVVLYGENGELPTAENVARFRSRLTALVKDRIERVTSDSPLFEYFRGLQVQLPDELATSELRYTYPAQSRTGVLGSDNKRDVERAEAVASETANVDPHAYIDLLSRYRDLGAWTDVIRLAESLPPALAKSPQVVPIVALAYNRLDQPDRAIELLVRYQAESGDDPESDGLLGSLYKKRYFADRRPSDLVDSIEHYRRGFANDPGNLYLGRTLAMVLQRAGRPAADELFELLPRVRTLAAEKIESSPVPDYWDIESALILSVIAHDWKAANERLDELLSLPTQSWMLDGTLGELHHMANLLTGDDSRNLSEMVDRMGATVPAEEEDDA